MLEMKNSEDAEFQDAVKLGIFRVCGRVWNIFCSGRPHSHLDHKARRNAAIHEATFSTIHT